MDKELKIVISIFSIFFVYGLGSVYYSGAYITPYFLNQLVLLGVAILFFGMNAKIQHSWILLLYIFVQFMACIVDGFTVAYLTQKFDSDVLIQLNSSIEFGVAFLIVYFGFFLFLSFYAYKNHSSLPIFLAMVVLIAVTVLSFFVEQMTEYINLIFSLYLIIFTIVIHRKLKQESIVLGIISYQAILLVLLEGLEYFQ